LDGPIFDDALRHVQIRPDLSALAVDRVTRDASRSEGHESSPGRGARRYAARQRMRKLLVEEHDLDRYELKGPWVAPRIRLAGGRPNDVVRSGVGAPALDGVPAGNRAARTIRIGKGEIPSVFDHAVARSRLHVAVECLKEELFLRELRGRLVETEREHL